MTTHLPNYLRAHRKGTGLSQRDVARLLGGGSGSKVSGYEHFRRTPTLRTALKLQVILRKPLDEVFEGMYKDAETIVANNAHKLLTQQSSKSDAPRARRLSELAQSLIDHEDVPF